MSTEIKDDDGDGSNLAVPVSSFGTTSFNLLTALRLVTLADREVLLLKQKSVTMFRVGDAAQTRKKGLRKQVTVEKYRRGLNGK